MSRPMLLVFLLLILIVTSQFEWKQPLVNEMEESPGVSQKQKRALDREEIVKEKDSTQHHVGVKIKTTPFLDVTA